MLDWSIKLFRVAGIRLELHVTFIAFLGFIAWLNRAAGLWSSVIFIGFFLTFFACVTLHELGHCLTARKYGINTRRITLLPIGGVAQLDSIPKKPRQELLITLAGPAVNFAIAGMLYPFFGYVDFDQINQSLQTFDLFFGSLVTVNLYMGIFNLLPVFPMDGGRIFRALMAFKLDYLKATELAVKIGKALALVAIGYVLVTKEFQMAAILFAFIYFMGGQELGVVRQRQSAKSFVVGDFINHNFSSLSSTSTLRDAWRTLDASYPHDIPIFEESNVVGLLEVSFLRSSKAASQDQELLAIHFAKRNVKILQPSDELEKALELSQFQRSFPVVLDGLTIGILDTQSLHRELPWRIRQRKALQNFRQYG